MDRSEPMSDDIELPDREVWVGRNRYDGYGDRPVEVSLSNGNQSQTFQLSRCEAEAIRDGLESWLEHNR